MKTDIQLQHDVVESLRWEPSVTEKGIGVTVVDGVVTLRGSVPTNGEKYAAERAAERVKGVRGVAQELTVDVPKAFEHSDTDLARSAANILDWNASVPKDRIKVRVQRGFLMLDGMVDSPFQRWAAERAVMNLAGVRGITNLLVLPVAPPSASLIKLDIEAAFKRSARLDAEGIRVEIATDTVILRGTVHSFEERREAERAAWAAPGVRRVDNYIEIRTTDLP